MSKFIKYCKKNLNNIIFVVAIIIVIIYISCGFFFPDTFFMKNQNPIILVSLTVFVLILLINTNRINKKNIKKLIKNYKELVDKYILLKVINILIIVKVLERIVTIIKNFIK